ncbi:hypothetical protein RHSIM_Rhsim11G0093800 [Rhododendron simsii]|uniref:DUF4378 domain-containing protein n=1 Tax=Rhododendron simsii TaxID=118357 RepID=A0A834LA62_RHOSS|nr:hypothetical protein RHSIM_Rhsim11G0093800 [Rhododendron simsii]
MDVEKRSSRGGFLQLFDWNIKSRKRLFSNKSELPEGTKQGNEDVANSLTLCPPFLEVRENGPGPRSKRTIDYNSASSVTGDDGYGTKAPGVVARLMGLDTLPTSTISEPCSVPYYESSFDRDSFSQRSTLNFHIERHIVLPSDEISRDLAEYRLQKAQILPIERFQTETLPPKSAKSIPVTRHRLLSPIKSPGFIPRNNVTYVMEAAAKMIEQGPPSTTKGKMPCVKPSSVPLRIRDLRARMEAVPITYGPEATRRPKDPISLKYSNGQDIGKHRSGSEDAQLYNASVASRKESSDSLKNKGKSVSLPVQAKVNAQRKEGSTSSGNRNSVNQKEGGEVKLERQTITQKKVQKRPPVSKTSDVLKQNNQKQNCVANKDKVALKPSVSNQKDRKIPSSNGSVRPNKASNKVINSTNGSRKMNGVAKDTGNELLSSKTKTSPQKKQSVHRDSHFEESIAKNISISKSGRSVKCNVSNDGYLNWDAVDKKSGMDVVSFTFTSPVKRSAPGSQASSQLMDGNARIFTDSCDESGPHDLKNPTSSLLGLNVIGGDSLSVLLEQKLKELASIVDSSNGNPVKDGSASCSAFSLQDSLSTLNITNTTTVESYNEHQMQKDKLGHPDDANCASVDALLLKANQKLQELEAIQGQSTSSNTSDYGEDLHYRFHSSLSNHEPSCSDRSYESSESKTCSIANGSQQSISAESYGMGDSISATKCQPVVIETELSDSASSTSAACRNGKNSSTPFSLTDIKKSSKWEVDYITEILNYSDLSVEDIVFGRINKAITPNLYDQLENWCTGCDENSEDFNLGRQVLFDYVGENMELKGERLLSGSCKSWSKWEMLFRRKGCLAEDLYREISSLTSMSELMVDELVDKDMSSWHGKWVDFETEAFEEGVEIEERILTSLVDELVADLLI